MVLREVYFSNNMLNVGFSLGACLLPPLTFHTPISGFFWLDHPWRSTVINNVFLSCGFGLIRPNKHFFILKLDHIDRKRVAVEFHLRTFCKRQSSFIDGRLHLSTEHVTIISSVRKRIVPLTISSSTQIFWRWNYMTLSHSN